MVHILNLCVFVSQVACAPIRLLLALVQFHTSMLVTRSFVESFIFSSRQWLDLLCFIVWTSSDLHTVPKAENIEGNYVFFNAVC